MTLDLQSIRAQFPALQRTVAGRPAAYLDGPGGTQVPQTVIDAMSDFMQRGGSNLGGPFATSQETEATVHAAREAMANLFNARSEEVAFGQNMTSLTFAASRAISRAWQQGDQIVVTWLDHDANISPWVLAAEERRVKVRWLEFDPAGCTLQLDRLAELLNERTRLLAITHASNAVGSITDVARAAEMAHRVGALVYVDAVHYAPHGLIDVQATGCDFLACSAYKFFGPHTGVMYGKQHLLESIRAFKVRPAPSHVPDKWETGTQSFESLAGVRAAVDYLASLGAGESRRAKLASAMARIKAYEESLSLRYLQGAAGVPGLKVYGITDVERLAERTPTFAVSLAGESPAQVAARLGEQGIFVWSGHYYAVAVMERLGTLDRGGLVRIGFAHYNTPEEVDRVLATL